MTKPTIDELQLFAEHHIIAAKKGKRGQILRVKHATEGWLTVDQYVDRQHMHEVALRSIAPIIEGGYRAKAALWGLTATAGPITIPIGLAFPLIEVKGLKDAIDNQNIPNMLQWGYALAGPFGDAFTVSAVYDWITSGIKHIIDWIQTNPAGGMGILNPVPPVLPPGYYGVEGDLYSQWSAVQEYWRRKV
jgi:hypothetical protein